MHPDCILFFYDFCKPSLLFYKQKYLRQKNYNKTSKDLIHLLTHMIGRLNNFNRHFTHTLRSIRMAVDDGKIELYVNGGTVTDSDWHLRKI